MYTWRTYGLAPVGERINRVMAFQHGRNITFLVAVTPDVGVLQHETFGPDVTRDDVAMFLTNLSTILDDEPASLPWTTPPPIVTSRLCHPDISPSAPFTLPTIP